MRPRQLVQLPAPSASDVVPVDVVPSANASALSILSSSLGSNSTSASSVSPTSGIPSSSSSASAPSNSISLTFGVPLPTVSPGSELGSPPFHVVDLIPVVVVLGVIFVIFVIWTIQGLCRSKSRQAFRESLYEDLEKAEDTPARSAGRSSLAPRRPAPTSPMSFVTLGPYQGQDLTTPHWTVSRFDTKARRAALQQGWTEVPVGSPFAENSSRHPQRRHGVTLQDAGPIPLSPNTTRQQRSAADNDWIREAGKRRHRSNSSKGIYSQSSSSNDPVKHRKVPVSANPFYLHRAAAEVTSDSTTDKPGRGVWSPRTGFHIIPDYSPHRTLPESPSPSTPILHASFNTMPSDEFINTSTLHSPTSELHSIQCHRDGYTYGRVSAADSSTILDEGPKPGARAATRTPSPSFMPSPPQIMSPPLQGELCFIPLRTQGLDAVLAEGNKSLNDSPKAPASRWTGQEVKLGIINARGKGATHPSSPRASLNTALPNPRSRLQGKSSVTSRSSSIYSEGINSRRSVSGRAPARSKSPDGVDVILLDNRRRAVFRKPSVLKGFSYERVLRNE